MGPIRKPRLRAIGRGAEAWIGHLAVATEVVATAVLVFVAILNLVNLILRYMVRAGIPEASEASAIAVVVIGFLGMARGFGDESHVRFLVADRWLHGRAREGARAVVTVLSLITLAILAYNSIRATWAFAHLTLVAVSMPWLPFWIPQQAMPVGAVVGLLVLLTRRRAVSLTE